MFTPWNAGSLEVVSEGFPDAIVWRHAMQGLTQYFANEPDFGMNFLMKVPDQCIYFLVLMWCLICISSIRTKHSGSDDMEEE